MHLAGGGVTGRNHIIHILKLAGFKLHAKLLGSIAVAAKGVRVEWISQQQRRQGAIGLQRLR